MKNISEKLMDIRQQLGFSREYVANCLGVSCSTIAQMELGNRKITMGEVQKFCQLYHISEVYILNQEPSGFEQLSLKSEFEQLNENDRQEILNLIAFRDTNFM